MKSLSLLSRLLRANRLFVSAIVILMLHFPIKAQSIILKTDTSISSEIQLQLNTDKIGPLLNYPNTLKRFYSHRLFQPAWVGAKANVKQTWDAMMELDCVIQFGLAHSDYHPNEVVYDRLHTILEQPDSVSNREKARYDIILTDALLTFMNHLHYGKLNPDFPSNKIDTVKHGFRTEDELVNAMSQKDIMAGIESVQPKSHEYVNLQNHMHLLTGVYSGDCYEIPDSDIREMAINMERLRWAETYQNDGTYVQINIPAYTLELHEPDTTYQFKVVVGKPGTPTPSLNSMISYFTTAPEWRVPHKIFVNEILPKALKDTAYLAANQFTIYNDKGNIVKPAVSILQYIAKHSRNYSVRQSSGCDNSLGNIVFRFANLYDIYLHDTPEQQLFRLKERSFSHGCIRVEHAEKLAQLLLKQDHSASFIPGVHYAIQHYQTKTFTLKKKVPIHVIYMTAEVKEGLLIEYKDIYNLDKSLEMALYNADSPLALK